MFPGLGAVCQRGETGQWDHQTDHHLPVIHRKHGEGLAFYIFFFLFSTAHLYSSVPQTHSLALYGRPKIDGELKICTPEKKSKQDRYVLNDCGFFLRVSAACLTGVACVWLFFRFAFLFDKAMFVCKKKGGETFELKDIIELQCYHIRDDPSGEKDNKKVFHRSDVHPVHLLEKANIVCVFMREQWSHVFLLLDGYGSTGYDLYFKTRELKKKWLEQFEMALWVTKRALITFIYVVMSCVVSCIQASLTSFKLFLYGCRSNMCPENSMANGHDFQMHCFEGTTSCRACSMLLRCFFSPHPSPAFRWVCGWISPSASSKGDFLPGLSLHALQNGSTQRVFRQSRCLWKKLGSVFTHQRLLIHQNCSFLQNLSLFYRTYWYYKEGKNSVDLIWC